MLSAFQDVEDQAVLLRQLALAAAEEDAGVRAAGRSLDVALNRYREGAASYLEVVTAQTLCSTPSRPRWTFPATGPWPPCG